MYVLFNLSFLCAVFLYRGIAYMLRFYVSCSFDFCKMSRCSVSMIRHVFSCNIYVSVCQGSLEKEAKGLNVTHLDKKKRHRYAFKIER